MGTNTLQTRSAGETITADFFNDFNTALQTEFVGRNASGAATSGQGLGSSTVPWGTGYFNSIVLGGDALDTTQITSPPNRIVSGATRGTSNQPNYLTANGSAATLTINGNTTNLVFDVNGSAVTCSTQITVSSLSAAPSSNNTCLVNMAEAADQETTRYWGEKVNKFTKAQISTIDTITTANPLHEHITIDTVGSEISGLVGKYAAFKINDGSSDEFFLAFVKSATELTNCTRGCFFGSDGNPINRIKFANNDTITLMKLTWIFLQNDGTTADVTYNNPVWSFDEPGSPSSGDYWYDLGNDQWKRYSGSAFVSIDRTFIGISIQDTSHCKATRSLDFYYSYKDTNTITVERTSATNCQVNNTHGNIYVYSGNLDFKIYKPEWNITTDLASTTNKDAYASESASTYYYLYFKDTGDRVISDIGPIFRADLLGEYHPNNPWRCVGVVFNNSSSNLEGLVHGSRPVYPSVVKISNRQSSGSSAGGPGNTDPTTVPWNTIEGDSWFIISLSSNEVKLEKGLYYIEWFCNGRSMETFRYSLYHTSPSIANTLQNGIGNYSAISNVAGAVDFGWHYLEVTDETIEYGIYSKCSHGSGNSSYGWGNATSFGGSEVFNLWKITKLA